MGGYYLAGAYEVEEAGTAGDAEVGSGVVKGRGYDGGADVVPPDFFGRAWLEVGVPESEHAREVISFPVACFLLRGRDEFVELFAIKAIPLVEAVEIEAVSFEAGDGFAGIRALERFAGEKAESFGFGRAADNSEMAVVEKAVACAGEFSF